MSEQNITTIIINVEALYRDYRRHGKNKPTFYGNTNDCLILPDVTSTLTTLIINSISNHSSLLDSFVVIYAAFVSSLYKIIGIDFAANFVQHAVASYEQYHAAMQASSLTPSSSQDIEVQKDGKECSNLLVLISELYNFQVISSVLVFDMIRALLDGDLTEFNVELLLKLLRSKLLPFLSYLDSNTLHRFWTATPTGRSIRIEGHHQHCPGEIFCQQRGCQVLFTHFLYFSAN